MKMHLLFYLLLNPWTLSPANATSFNIQPFSEFTQAAPNVVRGMISNVHTENAVTNDGGKTIYTYANVGVKEVLKGNIRTANIIIRKLGGTKDGTTLEIPSSPEFIENEDTVLFLSIEKEDRSYEVMGLELGKFGLEEKNGDIFLTGGMFAYTHTENDHDHPGKNQKPWSLTQVRDLIRTQNASPSAKSGSTPAPSATANSVSTHSSNKFNSNEVETTATTELPSKQTASSYYYWIAVLILAIAVFFIFRRR